MSAKCTKDLIVETINNALNAQPKAETTKVFKSTVNNLMGYMAELGINNRADLKIHLPGAKVFAPYIEDLFLKVNKLDVQVKAGSKVFLVKNREIESSTFLEPSVYSNPEQLIEHLTSAGVNVELATQIAAVFKSFATQTDNELVSTNTVYENYVLPLLFGANKVEGKDTTYHLPRPVIFSASTALLRWFATEGVRTLNSFTETQIQMIVGVDRTSDIIPSTLKSFRNLGHGGILRGEAARSLGSLIFESLNITSNLAESSPVVNSILAHQLGTFALEIGVKMGLIETGDVVYTVNQNGDVVTKKFSHYFITKDIVDVNNIDLTQITNHSKQLDSFFGVRQSFNAPSSSPIPDISRKIRGSLGLVSLQAQKIINKLKNTEWTINSSFFLYMIGADTSNTQLANKASKLRRVLAGVTFLTASDKAKVHVDLEDGITSKDNQLLDQIKAIKKYYDNNLINSFYLKWKFMVQGRMMVEGDLDPMASKNVARFLLKPAKAKSIVIDPAKKDSTAVISFKVAVAQHFDLNVDKTDVQGTLELFNEVLSDLENTDSALSKAIEAVIALSSNPNEVLQENYLDAMLELHAKYPKTNTALIMAVNSLAQYQSALAEGTTFVTDIIAEADATTSGFGIGLLLFPSAIDVMQAEVNRVGLTFEGQLPYSELVKNVDGLTPDGYLNFANALFDKFENLDTYLDSNSVFTDSKLAEKRFNAFNTVFSPLIVNRRNSGKPPFLVLNYEGGTTKVATELAVSLVDSLFEYIADTQERYTNGSPEVKASIIKELSTMFSSMKTLTQSVKGKGFLPEGLSSSTIRSLLNSGKLHKLSYDTPLYRGATLTYKTYLINKLAGALAPAIGVSASETIVNSGIKADFVKAAELHYFMFKVMYTKKIGKVTGRTDGKLFSSQREEIAKELISLYPKIYPKIALKYQDGKVSFIDLVKSTQVQHSTKFEIKFKSGNVSARMLTYAYAPPGASAVVRVVQGTDAIEEQDAVSIPNAENSQIPLLPLHDAVLEVIGSLPTTKAVYNNSFKDLASNPSFDVFSQLEEMINTTWDTLEDTDKDAVREAYLNHAYINRDINPPEKKISFDEILNKINATSKKVTKNRQDLAKKVENATSEHMYIAAPESTESIDISAQVEAIKKSLDSKSKDYQHSSNYKLLKDNRELFRILTKRLTRLYPHIKLEEKDSLVDKYGEEVLGNAIGAAIQYSKSKGALDTVPHEYAHIYLNLLEHTTIIGEQIAAIGLIHKVDRKEAKEILANEMGRIFTDKVLKDLHPRNKKVQSIVRRVWEFIKKLFKPLFISAEKEYAQHIYNELAWKLINGISGEALSATPKKGYTLQKFDTILENNPWGAEVIQTVLNKMLPEAMIVGSLALVGEGNIYRAGKGSLHDIDFAIPFSSFKPVRGLKGNIKTYDIDFAIPFFPQSKLLYEYNNKTSIAKATEIVMTYVVPPTGTKIINLERFQSSEFGRVIAWDIVDIKNPTNIIGSYRADAIKDPNAPKRSIRSNLVSETTTGVEAVLVDFLTDRDILPPKTIFSSYLGEMVKVSNPKSVFDAKNAITKENIPRDKDVMDFNLFKPNKDGITPPNLFGKITKGSSFLELLEKATTWHNNAPLTLSAMSIFNDLGKQDIHYDADHAKHLQNILQKLVLEHLSNAEDVVVQTAFIKGKTRGGFSEELRKVVVQLNESAPITYAEQSPQEVYVHEVLHAVIDHILAANPQLRVELTKLHLEAIKHITVEDFLIDKIKTDEVAEREIATQQYEYVYKDSTEFLIYALTNKGLVKRMQDVAPNRPDRLWEGTKFMDKVINLIKYAINAFNTKVRHKKLSTSQYQDFYNLGLKIATINNKHERSLMSLAKRFHIEALVEQGSDAVADAIIGVAKKTRAFALKDTEVGKVLKNIDDLPEAIKKVATNKAFLKAYEALADIEQIEVLSRLVKDLVVGTGSLEVMDLVLQTKGLIDSNRIHKAKSLVKKLRSHTKSKIKVSKKSQISLTKVVLKTDLQALLHSGRFTLEDIVNLIQHPQLLHNKIREYESRAGTSTNMFYKQQAEGLSKFMMRTDSASALQALNAHRMYQLHQHLYGMEVKTDASIIQELDILVSLLALQLVPEGVRESALTVINAEMAVDSSDNLISVMLEQRKLLIRDDLHYNFGDSPYAMIKGFTRNSYNANVEIVSAPLKSMKQMKKEGFVFAHELPYIPGVNKTKFGLYVNTYNPEAGRTTGAIPYSGNQAKGTTLFEILSNDPAYQKIDPSTGNMVGDPKLIRPVIETYIAKQKELLLAQVTSGKMSSSTQLIPLINEKGAIYDFRVMMTTAMQEQLLDPDMTYENVMSKLMIHHMDKKMTGGIEKVSMAYLVKVMNTEYKGKYDRAFINILDKKYYEQYYLPLSSSFKARIEENAIKTDKGMVFPIKKEELHIMFGAKDMSVRDLPHFDKYPANLKKGLLRVNEGVLGVIGVAVTNIIMKMPEVLEDNIISNTIILMLNGLNPVKAVRLQLQAVGYLRDWKNTTSEMMELYFEYHGSAKKDRKLLLRLTALGESLEDSPIYELMQKKLFTSMVEEIHLRESSKIKWATDLEDKMGKYGAAPILTVAKWAYMTKSTAPYEAMQEVFQMSDFLARYALDTHLKTTNMHPDERKRVVYESFVLYDVPGTSRLATFINKTGFTFFYSYWFKMQRAITKTLIRRTKSSIFLLGLQNVADVNVPDIFDTSIMTGNFAPPLSNPVEALEHVIKLPGVELVKDILN